MVASRKSVNKQRPEIHAVAPPSSSDRDCASFRELTESGRVKTIRLPARSPHLNSYAEQWEMGRTFFDGALISFGVVG